jgi:hypothetical protein
LWGSSPRVDFEGSIAALDSIAKVGYLDGGLTPKRNWRGSFTRKGYDYARWRRMNPVLRTVSDRVPAAWKVTSALVSVGAKLKDVLPT